MSKSYDLETLPEVLREYTLEETVAALVARHGVDSITKAMGEYLAKNVKGASKSSHVWDEVVIRGQKQRADILLTVAKVLKAL
jgi:hypothetical protein